MLPRLFAVDRPFVVFSLFLTRLSLRGVMNRIRGRSSILIRIADGSKWESDNIRLGL